VTDKAAALTYYALLSLFPALLFGVSLLGVFGAQSLIPDTIDYLRKAGVPNDTVKPITDFMQSAIDNRDTATVALVLGLATALWGASGAFGAVGRALNVIFRVDEGRGFVRKKVTDLVSTLLILVLVLITFVLIFVGGGLAEDILGVLGLGDSAAAVWTVLRWPAAMAVTMAIYAYVYYAAPNVEVRTFRYITPGAVTGVVVWIVASAGFFFYVSNFGKYDATYGAFAGAVVLLLWLWLSNIALLFGAEVNAAADLRRSPDLPEGYDGPILPEKVPAKSAG
jgi:membrane protein